MAQRNVKYGYAFARFVVSDGVTVATQTLADTSAIPLGAIMTSTTVIVRGAIVSSGGSAALNAGTEELDIIVEYILLD